MKSPFPGMDPYIEACGLWGDFHFDLIAEIKHALAAVAPERYVVRADERSYMVLAESEGKRRRAFIPDVGVVGPQNRKKPTRKNDGVAVAEHGTDIEPVTMRALVAEEHREAFIEISEIDEATREQHLVTCIEVLSPSNKRAGSEGWNVYLRKRQSVMLGGVNLVEIDLLRQGERMPMLDPWPKSPYTVLVARAFKEYACRVWQASFQQALCLVPVPLAKPDADLPLELQPMIEAIYARGHYERDIDYRKPLTPPLDANDTAWLQKRLRTRKSPA
jgi:hypothetical protein